MHTSSVSRRETDEPCRREQVVPITAPVDFSWRFEQYGETIVISRDADPDAATLVVTGARSERVFGFATHEELVAFQAQFEQHLVTSGWQFAGFSPERRTRRMAAKTPVPDRRRVVPFLRAIQLPARAVPDSV
jgi:hypothetical protein